MFSNFSKIYMLPSSLSKVFSGTIKVQGTRAKKSKLKTFRQVFLAFLVCAWAIFAINLGHPALQSQLLPCCLIITLLLYLQTLDTHNLLSQKDQKE